MLCSVSQFSLPPLLPLTKCWQRITRHYQLPSSLLARQQDQAPYGQITMMCMPCRQVYYEMNKHSIWFWRLLLGRARHITYWFRLFAHVPFSSAIGSKSFESRLIGSGYDFSFGYVNPQSIHWNTTYNFRSTGRPLFVVNWSIGVIPSVPADNHYYICVIQPCQLVCLLDQIRSPSGEPLRFCFGRVQRLVDLFRSGRGTATVRWRSLLSED